VVASLYWQDGPANPVLHWQAPLAWAVPRPLHVSALLNWQADPAKPVAHVHEPSTVEHVPLPLQVEVA
jgi:hypothetical protein